MFKFRLTVDTAQLDDMRKLPQRALWNLKREMQTDLKPLLQQDIETLLGHPPGPVSAPFEFGTDRSRRYYFALITQRPELSDGHHWLRTNLLEDSFEVRVSDRLVGNLVTIGNILRQSTGTRPFPGQFVYDPFAVAGHLDTGWQEQYKTAQRLLQEKLRRILYQMWQEALSKAIQGRSN